MIPTVLYEEPSRGRDLRRLAGAVLTQAITDLRGNMPRRRREAAEWIFQGNSGVITFETCCAYLNRDPDRVRDKIAQAFGPPRHIVQAFAEASSRAA